MSMCRRGPTHKQIQLRRVELYFAQDSAHGDVDGGGRHDVKDTMPTDPTRTKRGRTKKSEKDPPKNKKTRAAHRQPDIDVLLRCNLNCQ